MALADYNLRYELPFKDVDGNQWRVQIFDRDEAGSVERLKGTGTPVSIYYEGDEEFTKGVIGSSCSIRVYGTPELDGTSDLTQFFTADEERFYVVVEYFFEGSYEKYWTGFLHQDEYTEHIACDPYEVELVALDRMSTTKVSLNELEYNTDSEPTLLDLVESFIDTTGLEFDIVEDTGLEIEGESNTEFLSRQRISAESFLVDKDTFFEMIPITEVMSNMMIALNCRMWQQQGKLHIKHVNRRWAELANTSIPYEELTTDKSLISVDNNMIVRHLPAKRVTTLSVATRGRNLFFNPSFERSDLGDTTPVGWVKPAGNTAASIEVSDDLLSSGSNRSLKTINNRISDSGFDALSISQKNNQYCVLDTITRNVQLNNQLITKDYLQAKVSLDYFINNPDNSENYELRISISRPDFEGNIKYYNFDSNGWSNSFRHTSFVVQSTGEWDTIEMEFLLNTFDFFPVLNNYGENDQPFNVRIHTMNYKDDGSLNNVQVFFDNFRFNVYNADGDVRTAFRPDTSYYVLSTDDDTTTKTDTIDLEVNQGITTAEIKYEIVLADKFPLMYGKVLGQYLNESTSQPDNISFRTDVSQVFNPLPVELIRLRRLLDGAVKKVTSSTLATKREGHWVPLFFGDRYFLNYNLKSSGINAFTRFDFDVKGNRYSIESVNV